MVSPDSKYILVWQSQTIYTSILWNVDGKMMVDEIPWFICLTRKKAWLWHSILNTDALFEPGMTCHTRTSDCHTGGRYIKVLWIVKYTEYFTVFSVIERLFELCSSRLYCASALTVLRSYLRMYPLMFIFKVFLLIWIASSHGPSCEDVTWLSINQAVCQDSWDADSKHVFHSTVKPHVITFNMRVTVQYLRHQHHWVFLSLSCLCWLDKSKVKQEFKQR